MLMLATPPIAVCTTVVLEVKGAATEFPAFLKDVSRDAPEWSAPRLDSTPKTAPLVLKAPTTIPFTSVEYTRTNARYRALSTTVRYEPQGCALVFSGRRSSRSVADANQP